MEDFITPSIWVAVRIIDTSRGMERFIGLCAFYKYAVNKQLCFRPLCLSNHSD